MLMLMLMLVLLMLMFYALQRLDAEDRLIAQHGSKKHKHQDEVVIVHLTLLMDVALLESAIEGTFKTQKASVDYSPTLEDTILKYDSEKDRMLIILTYDFESSFPKNASFLQGTTIKILDELNRPEDFDSFIREHFHSENNNIFMMDDLDDDLNEKKKEEKSNNNNNNNNNSNNNNKFNLGAVKTHKSDVRANDDSNNAHLNLDLPSMKRISKDHVSMKMKMDADEVQITSDVVMKGTGNEHYGNEKGADLPKQKEVLSCYNNINGFSKAK